MGETNRREGHMVVEDRPEWGGWMTRRALLGKPIHRWLTFPHSFASDLVHALVEEWKLSSTDVILDPFVGAGTTTLAAKERQVPATGYDLSPLAVLTSRAKISAYQPARLRSLFGVLSHKLQVLQNQPDKGGMAAECSTPFLARALPGDLLHRFRSLLRQIDGLAGSTSERDFFKLALVAIIPAFSRAQASGGWLRWTDVGRHSGELWSTFVEQVQTMLEDLDSKSTASDVSWQVGMADARSLPDGTGTYSAVITSPPYPNRHDYTRVFGVELMTGFLTWQETKQLRRQSIQSHPESRPERPGSERYSQPEKLGRVLARLKEDHVDRRIPKMLGGYFRDIWCCLRETKRVCKPGAKLAFVVGNVRYGGHVVPVDELTAELGEDVGLECEKIVAARYRGNSAQQMGKHGRRRSRESVVIFERRP